MKPWTSLLPILALASVVGCEGFVPSQKTPIIVSEVSTTLKDGSHCRRPIGELHTKPNVILQRRSSLKLFYQDDDARDSSSTTATIDRQKEFERQINSFLRASQRSFQNVESMTNRLLNRQPLVALALFVGAGALVAYLSGLIFLGGYIETWNPAENDAVPYWDEEILIITRKVGR